MSANNVLLRQGEVLAKRLYVFQIGFCGCFLYFDANSVVEDKVYFPPGFKLIIGNVSPMVKLIEYGVLKPRPAKLMGFYWKYRCSIRPM